MDALTIREEACWQQEISAESPSVAPLALMLVAAVILRFYHLHTLRHFYATYLLQEGTSKQVAASLLGHADTAFLERTYCHPQDVAKQQAAKLMQDLLNNKNPCYVAFMKNKNRKAKKAG